MRLNIFFNKHNYDYIKKECLRIFNREHQLSSNYDISEENSYNYVLYSLLSNENSNFSISVPVGVSLLQTEIKMYFDDIKQLVPIQINQTNNIYNKNSFYAQ